MSSSKFGVGLSQWIVSYRKHEQVFQRKKNFVPYSNACCLAFHLGGPFDLMSRRLIVASSKAIAQRIAKEITEFHVGRDDTE